MTVRLSRVNDAVHLCARSEDGVEAHIDGSPAIGGTSAGLRPMEALLAALGSCAAMDMITILQKQRAGLTHFEVVVEGERHQVGKSTPFSSIRLTFVLNAGIDHAKAERAAQLSVHEYCSVADSLRPGVDIAYQLDYLDLEYP